MPTLDHPLTAALAALSCVAIMLSLQRFLEMLPVLWECAVRWKSNVELEDSLQLSRSRNYLAAILIVPDLLITARFQLYSPRSIQGLHAGWALAALAGVFLAYILFRAFLDWQLETESYGSKFFTAANRSFLNFFVLASVLLLALAGFSAVAGLGLQASKRLILIALTLTYFWFVFKRTQIFSSASKPLTTFLYLCGLELIPTGALVLSARLF